MTSLVFFGNEQFSSTKSYRDTPVLENILKAGYSIEAIITKSRDGQSKPRLSDPVIEMARKHKIPLLKVNNKSELCSAIQGLSSEIAVLASFGLIIPTEVIAYFRKGIVNIHPSLLPIYRGPSPIEAAILNGDKQTGVSIMKLTAGMDEGGVYTSSVLGLTGQETKLELTKKLARLGAKSLIQILPEILSGLEPREQDPSKATYTKLIKKEDGVMDFGQPSEVLVRQIRGYADWPGSQTTILQKNVIISTAYDYDHKPKKGVNPGDCEISFEDKLVLIACRKGWLSVERLKLANRKEVSALEFINGLGGAGRAG